MDGAQASDYGTGMSDRGGRPRRQELGGGQSSLAAMLLGALTFVFGLQFLRLLVVALSVNLVQINELSSVLVGGLGLAVFGAGFLAPAVHRTLGRRAAAPAVFGGLGLLRIAEQFTASVSVDLALSIAGTVLFLWALPLLLRSVRADGDGGGPHAAIALLLALSIDTAVKAAFGTVDLSWAGGAAAHAVTAVLVAAQWALLLAAAPARPQRAARPAGSPSWGAPYLIVGPVLVLELLTFQNVALQTVLTGWRQPAALALILAANLAAAAAAAALARSGRTLHGGVRALLGAVLIASVASEWTGAAAALAVAAGHAAIALLLVSVTGSAPASDRRRGGAVSAWTTAGMLALLVLLFIYYAHYDIALPLPQAAVRPFAALLVALAALRAAIRSAPAPAAVARTAVAPALLALAVPAVLAVTWNRIEPAAGNGFPVRVMTYNVHQGFDARGRHGMEALAQVIEAEDPDVVALQEITRGWLINGSVDTLIWLSRRLGMDYVFGPAGDSVWGNAVLSRFPVKAVRNRFMPNNDDIVMDRAFLTLEVDLGGGESLEVLATHFHNGEEEEDAAHRMPQALAVLEAIDSARTVVLLGDLNASPDHPEMLEIAAAGFVDAFAAAGPGGDGFTWPAGALDQRIDYVWTSPDLTVTDYSRPVSTASDHLAVAVTVDR